MTKHFGFRFDLYFFASFVAFFVLTQTSCSPHHNDGGWAANQARLEKEIGEARKSGQMDVSYATNVNDLGEIYRMQGQYKESEPLLLEAVALRKELLGSKHPDYAISLDNLGILTTDIGNYEKAKQYHKDALSIFSAVGPERALDKATCLNNLAWAEKAGGQYGEARTHYEQSLALFETLVAPTDMRRRTAVVRLAEVYEALGLSENAKALLQRAVQQGAPMDDLRPMATGHR